MYTVEFARPFIITSEHFWSTVCVSEFSHPTHSHANPIVEVDTLVDTHALVACGFHNESPCQVGCV